MGTGFDVNISKEDEGIVPRAVSHLFDGIDKRQEDAKQNSEPPPNFKVTVQFMEVNENKCLYFLFESLKMQFNVFRVFTALQ